jgi:Kef-type K+ transport system membrane component KefB
MIENTLLILLLILGFGLLIPELLKKFRLPFVTLIILAGAITGPSGFNYVQPNEIINFFGFLGMAFLMLLAGLETNIAKLTHAKTKILIMAGLSGGIPFTMGLVITKLFGYDWITSTLIGIVFISSSVAVIIPSLRESKVFHKEFGQLVLAAILTADIASLLALSFIFQNTDRIANLPLQFYFVLLFATIPLFFYVAPRFYRYAVKKRFFHDEGNERQLRFVIIVLAAALALFALLGVHPIIASFLTGLALSGVIKRDPADNLRSKLHTLGYGLFVPVFFFLVGTEMDLTLLKHFDIDNILMLLLIVGLLLSKLGSGYLAGRLVKLRSREAWLFGAISIPQLTTTLAVTYTAAALGLLDSVLVTSIILIAIISTFIGPMLVSYLAHKKLS